jgi:type 1 glutamine amidotransferase
MRRKFGTASTAAAVCATATLLAGVMGVSAQQPPAGQGRGAAPGGGGRGGGIAPGLFVAVDTNKDGGITREEMRGAFERWFTEWDSEKKGSLSQEQVVAGMAAAVPVQQFGGGFFGGRGQAAQNQTPQPEHVTAMVAALPAAAPAKPKQPRRVLVLGRAAGFVHSSIPIAARTIEEMGKKTGAWSTTITYDAADINEANLKQYDAIVLASTTGAFLDDPNDAAATEARRRAFLQFVRSGKGLAGIHAATDSYHRSAKSTPPGPPPAAGQGRGGGRAGRGGGRGGQTAPLSARLMTDGDKNTDQRLSREEFLAVADVWYDKLDPSKAGRIPQAGFSDAFAAVIPPPPPPALGRTGFPIQAPATQLGADDQIGTWPEFNKMIGGFFKFHWNDGQEITYKIDEPNHPLNAPFKKLREPLLVVDETYTFGRDTYSRQNLRVLTSVDYAKMSDEDKKKEQYPRDDGDYALSWIKRDGQGRVFYMAHGHNEKVYAIQPLLEHLLYGMQYVLGDLPADDAPSQKAGTK